MPVNLGRPAKRRGAPSKTDQVPRIPLKHRKPLCHFISTSVFQTPAYLCLPEDGQARFLFVLLLLHPLGCTFHTPGIY